MKEETERKKFHVFMMVGWIVKKVEKFRLYFSNDFMMDRAAHFFRNPPTVLLEDHAADNIIAL